MALIRIERMGNGDWQRYRKIRLRSLADAPDAFGSTLAREEAWDETVWRERLSDDHAGFFLAVDATGGDVGVVAGAPFRGRDGAGLFQMWVDPKFRGDRIGETLIDAVIDWAIGMNHKRLILEVGDRNASAIRLYERRGFQLTGNASTLDPPHQHITEHERLLVLSE